jgi:hypothetical protein
MTKNAYLGFDQAWQCTAIDLQLVTQGDSHAPKYIRPAVVLCLLVPRGL